MGIGGIGIWQLLIILLIVFMLFGTKKLRSLGSDLGGALKGFRSAMKDEKDEQAGDPEDEAIETAADPVAAAKVKTSEKAETG